MDNESKGAASALWTQGAVLALALGVGSLFMADVPFVSGREADHPPRIDQRFDLQDVDARLWQDPLGVVRRQRETDAAARGETAPAASAAAAQAPADHDPGRLRRAISEQRDGQAVLAVMLRGGPYSEFVEQRRRTRYAILAALNEAGFAPRDSDHLGWIAGGPGTPETGPLPEAIPFEWLDISPDRERNHDEPLDHVLVLWLDDRAFTRKPVAQMSALAEALTPPDSNASQPWRIIGPPRSDVLLQMAREGKEALEPPPPAYARLHFYAASPTVSDQTILGITETGDATPLLSRALERQLGILLTRTIPNDAQLARALIQELKLRGLRPGTLESPARDTPAGDTTYHLDDYGDVCRAGRGEDGAERLSHIAVVAEWDTLYGRSLRRLFRPGIDSDGFCVDRFTYMRGLDGMRPDEVRDGGRDEDAKSEVPATGSDARRRNGTYIERAEGQSQFDYLRRLAKQMHERDDALRRAGRGDHGIEAIGVLGNDTYDKLLVLQALQPEFPSAVFFTTDLDARFLHPRELPWTRNLVVASGFGLRLDDRLQVGTPPFRDSYQTSEYFATRLAIHDARRLLSHEDAPVLATAWPHEASASWRQEDLPDWLGAPRIFEIGRTRAFDFTGRPATTPPDWLDRPVELHSGAAAPKAAKRIDCRGDRWLDCADVHPPGSDPAPAPGLAGRWLVCALLSLLWLPVMSTWHLGGLAGLARVLRSRDPAPARRHRHAVVLALLAALQFGLVPLGLALAWPPTAAWMAEGGKPLVFTEGISTWPTEFIRLFAVLLGLYLLLRGWRGLERNQHAISKEFSLLAPRAAIEASQAQADTRLPRLARLSNMFGWSAVEPRGLAPVRATGLRSHRVEELWRMHVVQNRLGARLVRSLALAVAALGLSWLVMLAFHDERHVPARGALSRDVHEILHVLVFLVLYLVVMFVADATVLCVRFLLHLFRVKCLWPSDAIERFTQELGFRHDEVVKHWINLRFVAQRTAEVNRLMFHPFIMLSLVLLSRSPALDDWPLLRGGVVLAAVGVAVALLCALSLRQVAEKARAGALKAIDRALLLAHAGAAAGPMPAGAPTPAQLELLREEARRLRQGAFARWSQQPLLKALALPFATLGGSSLVEYLSLMNL